MPIFKSGYLCVCLFCFIWGLPLLLLLLWSCGNLLFKLTVAWKNLRSHGFSSGFSSLGFLLGLIYSFNKHLHACKGPGIAGLREVELRSKVPPPVSICVAGGVGDTQRGIRVRLAGFESQYGPSRCAWLYKEFPYSVRLGFFPCK